MGLLLITRRPVNVARCVEELGNVLYPYDQGIVFEETPLKGVVVLKTELDPMEAFRILKSSEYGFVERIVPFQIVVENASIDDIVSKALALVKPDLKTICLRIRVRGVRDVSSKIWYLLKRELLDRGVVVKSDAEYCIYVESIEKLYGLSLLKNKEDRVH